MSRRLHSIKEHAMSWKQYLFLIALLVLWGCSTLDFEKDKREEGFRVLRDNVWPIRRHIARNLIVTDPNDMDIILTTEPQTYFYIAGDCQWYWPLPNNRGLLARGYEYNGILDPNDVTYQIMDQK